MLSSSYHAARRLICGNARSGAEYTRHWSLVAHESSFHNTVEVVGMTGVDGNSGTASCYSPLVVDHERQATQLRVVRLLPGKWPEPIRCQLTVHSLHDPPPYETISYAWGDSRDTKEISIDNVRVTIPSSLELCLRYLRDQEDELVLWTDAICINQADIEERAMQVMRMGEIYSRSQSMYIWLGEPRSSLPQQTGHPFAMFLHSAENKHFTDYPGFIYSKETGRWIFHDNAEYQQMYEEFLDLVSRSWWTRLWCVQEIALCPRAVVVMGSWRLPWETILEAKNNHYRHTIGCCEGISSALPAKYTFFLDHMLFLSQKSTMAEMDHVIRSLRHKLCKDPRDKIYGLLGLIQCETPHAILQADYTVPVAKLYCDVTKRIIAQNSGGLQFLTGSGLGSHAYQLPSWVRDFAAPLSAAEASNEHARYTTYHLYNADAQLRGKPTAIEGNTLRLSGTLVDRIVRIGDPIKDTNWPHILSTIHDWAEIAGISPLSNISSPTSLEDCFWRTILADCIPATHSGVSASIRIPKKLDTSLSNWFSEAKSRYLEGGEPLVTSHVHAFWKATHGRAFFTTEKGRVGLCFPHSRPGDEVWVLVGGQVPFVLRQAGDPEESIDGRCDIARYRLVGECYSHGVMDGEVVTDDWKGPALVYLV